MKKVLLIAVAAFVAASVSAQSLGKKVGKLRTKRSDKQELYVNKASAQKEAKKAIEVSFKQQQKLLSKKIDLKNAASIKAANNKKVTTGAPRKVGTVQPEYTGYGTVQGNGKSPWTMTSGTFEDGTLALIDVIPNPYPGQVETIPNIPVEYTISGSTITIEPQLVLTTTSWYGFIFGSNNADNTITMTLGEDGSLTLPEGEMIFYGAFSSNTFDSSLATYLGVIEYTSNIKYLLPGQEIAPTVEYMPAGINLYANISPTGYGYNDCYGIIPAFTNVVMKNYTTDPADSWEWSIRDDAKDAIHATSSERDFSFYSSNSTYQGVTLIGTKGSLSSDPFVFGTSKGSCEAAYLSAGDIGDSFQFKADNSYSTITPANPDNDFAYYSGYATPDKNTSRSITAIAEYMGKPEAPLYIEGVNFLVRNFEVLDAENFNLKCKIVKATMNNGWPEYGDVIAEAELNLDDVKEGYSNSGNTLYQLNWNNFYTEDEDGMSDNLDYIFIEDEFAIIIEGWDNGTFSVDATYGEYNNNSNAPTYTFFTKDGQEMNYDNERSLGHQTHQMIGFNGAVWGYLKTSDNTNIEFPEEGGDVTLHIEPMLYEDKDGNALTWLEVADGSELPEWISFETKNDTYTETENSFDLVLTADPLNSASGAPRKEAAAGRQATFTLMQPGAKLDITVKQGAVTGISDVQVTKTTTDGKVYNVAGQRLNSNAKGLIIKDGKKMIVK